jgi:hypothetical protein
MVARRLRPSQQTPQSTNPLVPSGADLVFGGNAFKAPSNVVERGVIASCDALRHIYMVQLNSGQMLPMARIRTHHGDLTLLTVGTFVVVTFALGNPYIMGVLPPDTASTYSENPESITDVDGFGGNDPLLSRSFGGSSRGAGEPQDLAPGDFVAMSQDGASLSVLQGQVAQLRGSPLAKVQAFGDNDLVQIVAGVLRVITWMGESNVVNNKGKTSFIWRGGSDQLTQTGSDEEKYTIKLDVGHTGDMINFEVCTRSQQTVFKFHVSPQGAVELFAAGGFNQHSGANVQQIHPVNFNGSVVETITGGASRTVSGDVQERHDGSRTEVIASDHSVTVGQDQAINVSRNRRVATGGDNIEEVAGKRKISSFEENTTEILGPGKAHTIRTIGGAHQVLTTGGAITMNPGPGTFSVLASPEMISLGTGAVSHAVKWEEMNVALQAMAIQLSTMHALLAAHVHPAGPFTPDPTLSPLASPVLVELTTARGTVKVA